MLPADKRIIVALQGGGGGGGGERWGRKPHLAVIDETVMATCRSYSNSDMQSRHNYRSVLDIKWQESGNDCGQLRVETMPTAAEDALQGLLALCWLQSAVKEGSLQSGHSDRSMLNVRLEEAGDKH